MENIDMQPSITEIYKKRKNTSLYNTFYSLKSINMSELRVCSLPSLFLFADRSTKNDATLPNVSLGFTRFAAKALQISINVK